jgi:DNA-binding response OmpR family regulator
MAKTKIMIVEDDEDLHVLYGLYLQSHDYEIIRAYNGQEALDKVDAEAPALIILDMIMPVMDGEEFFVKLRTEKKNTHTPVIIASVNDKVPERLFTLGGIHATLKKPFTIDTLLREIQKALSKTSSGR